jgi:hypothetical protein
MTFAFPETMAIVTRTVTGTDSYGNDVYSPVESPIYGAFAPQGSTELVQGRETVLTHDTVYLEVGTAVPKPTDQVRRAGVLYDIDGTPRTYQNPFTGFVPGPVLSLLRVTG